MRTAAEQTAFLGLGSNLGDRGQWIERALEALSAVNGLRFTVRADCSGLYETAPVDAPYDAPPYLNAVLRVRTVLDPPALLQACLEIESRLGRERSTVNASRTIDIDLLLYGDSIVDERDLKVPHPRLHERRFVLEPLCELAPGLIHPTLGMTIETLAEQARRVFPAQHVQRLRGSSSDVS